MLRPSLKKLAEILLPRKLFSRLQAKRSKRTQIAYLERNGFLAINRRYRERWGLTVRNGPFAGMTYTEAAAANRHAIPHLLGSTELQLHVPIAQITAAGYERIVNIGCAEGYYAVGFALKTGAQVYAFDAELQELMLCKGLATANGVSGKMYFSGWCGPSELKGACGAKRCLVFSDCEGYEMELISRSTIQGIPNADYLIELHENEVPGVRKILVERLCGTHSVNVIADQPADAGSYPELAFLGDDAPLAVCESRQAGQEWLYAVARKGE